MWYTMKLLKSQIQDAKDKNKELRKNIPDAATLIYINQYSTDKQKLEKKKEIMIAKMQIQVI